MKKPKPPKVRSPESNQPTTHAVTVRSSQWSGPLPPPVVLEQFDRIVPGAAERIMRMAEKEQDHRLTLENTALGEDIASGKRAHYLGWSLAFVAVVAAAVAPLMGAHWMVSVALVGVPLMSVVHAIVSRK